MKGNLEHSFKNGAFNVVVEKKILRWYYGNTSVKERRERDKYQMMKDLTKGEMEMVKEDEYKFLKNMCDHFKIRKCLEVAWVLEKYARNYETHI